MKTNVNYYFLLLLAVTIPNIIVSQTVNSGDLYISPRTTLVTWGDFENKATGNLLNDGELFLYNHYNNMGMVSFKPSASASIIRFYGQSGAQNISGSGTNNWNNVEFNNDKTDYSFKLSTALTILGVVDFQHGIIDNVNFNGSLTLGPDATTQNVDNSSYVAGAVSKKGNKEFVFPIGDAKKNRWASIKALSAVTDIFSGQYFFKNPGLIYPFANKSKEIELINDKEYWEVNKVNGASTALVTLSWDAATSPDFIINAASETLHVVRWDEIQKKWIDEGGVMDIENKQVTAVSPTGYGVFTIAKVNQDRIDDLVKIHKPVSPNGDGKNDFLYIEEIDKYPNNIVTIYNRWGSKVFETTAYNNSSNFFSGYSNAAITNDKRLLPAGVYFYVLTFTNDKTGKSKDRSGYLYLNY